ncbi:MAG: FAD-binding oxidoreductase [Clostridia bacterium]|nr:FAD-binding oxidoreductase [Clostridia bacterium]
MCDIIPLRSTQQADAVVVGGGWTGLLTAHLLARHGLQVCLLTRTAGPLPPPLATLHQPERFRRIAAFHGESALRAHLLQLHQALAALPVPLRETEVYAFAHASADVPRLLAQQAFLARLGAPCVIAPDAGGCPFPVALSTCSPGLIGDAAPLAHALRQGVLQAGGRIFSARVMNANARQVFAEHGRVDAPHVLLCTGKPLGLAGRRLLSLMATRTIARARLDAPVPLHTVQSAVDGSPLLLPVSGGALVLWDAGRTGTRAETQGTAQFRRFLQRWMPEWPAAALQYRLHTRPVDGLPIVGHFRTEGGSILCAAGAEDFLSSVMAAQTLTRLALQRPIPADLALRPDRIIPRGTLRRMLTAQRKTRAVAALRASAPRCRHCRCRLRWHAASRWWGCPFCGSAFGALGQRIGGPSLFDADLSISQRPSW